MGDNFTDDGRTGTGLGVLTAPRPTTTIGEPPTRTGRGRLRQRVAVIDDHALFAESMDLALSRSGYDVSIAEVPNSAAQTAGLLTRVCRGRPAVVLLDLDLGAFGDGLRLIAPLVQSGATVIVLTADPDRARWGECLAHGARKVICKSGALNEVLATLRRLDAGLSVLDPGEHDLLIERWRGHRAQQQAQRSRLAHLTVREAEVLGHLTRGRTVQEIALRSVVSQATVRTQVKSILAKLQVRSQLAAVGLANAVDWHSPVD